jgi:CIC family chloride channel protein
MKIKIHTDYFLGKFKENLFASFIGFISGFAAAFLDFLIVVLHNLSFNLGLEIVHLIFLSLYCFISASVEASFVIPSLLLSLRFLKENILVSLFIWLSKFVGIALSLSILPLGREGPAMLLGTGLGQYISQLFKVPKGQLNYWGTIGAAAFVGAFLKVPLGATFYVFENRFGKVLNIDFLINALTASTVSYTVYAFLRGFHPIIHVEGPFNWNLLDLIPSVILGILTSIASIFMLLLMRFFQFLASLVPENYRPIAIFPAVLLLFIIAYNHEYIHLLELSVNYQPINEVSTNLYPVEIIFWTIILEIVFLTLLLSFGYPGGVVLPLIFIGASFGNIVAHLEPSKLSIFILTGAAAMLSAALNIPITAVIMISEMSHQTLIIPEMVGVLTAYFLTRSVKLLSC